MNYIVYLSRVGALAVGGCFEGDGTSALAVDAWFDISDVAMLDANGYLQIVERAKDVTKPGCESVSSSTLENVAGARAVWSKPVWSV